LTFGAENLAGAVLMGNLPAQSERLRAKRKVKSRLINKITSQHWDLTKIRAYAEVGCTLEEIAALLKISLSSLEKEKRVNHELEEAMQTGYANLRQSLRSAQVRVALTGNPTMLIWLGKQILAQSDKQEIRQETTMNVVLQEAVKELRDLDKEEILRIKSIIEQRATDAVVIES
jgi:hypothetical protein